MTEKKHLSELLSLATLADIAIPQVSLSQYKASAFVLLLSYSVIYHAEEDGDTSVTPLEVMNEWHESLATIVNDTEFRHLLEKQKLIAINTQVVQAKLLQILIGLYQNVDTSMAAYERNNELSSRTAPRKLAHLALFFVPYITDYVKTSLLTSYQKTAVLRVVQDHLREHYLEGETPLLLSTNATETLVNQMDKDVIAMVNGGSSLLNEAVSAYAKGTYNLFFIASNNALDIVIFLKWYNRLTDRFTTYLNKHQLGLTQKIEELGTKLKTLQEDIHQNAATLIKGDTLSYVADNQEEFIKERRKVQDASAQYRVYLNGWMFGKEVLDYIARFGLVVAKLERDQIPFDQYLAIAAAGRDVSKAYSWSSDNAGEITEFKRATETINNLMGNITHTPIDEKNTITYSTEAAATNGIELKNFSVGYSDTTLLDNQTITLDAGICAVTGESGSGKSSFLSKIRGIQCGGLWAQGDVTYWTPSGYGPVIHYATQEVYIPRYSTLLEIITLKNRIVLAQNPNLERRVTDLLREINIDDKGDDGIIADLNTEKDWRSILSGGQRKKIAILRTLLREPGIAILDETFAGLDPASVQNVQYMLKQYLPDTLLLIVDHNVEQNNYDRFYDFELHLANQAITRRDIAEAR